MAIRFDPPNSRDMGKILMSDDMGDAMLEVGRDAANYAATISPRDTGEYASSFEVERATFEGPRGQRKGARLVNTADHAAEVEWGQERHILGQTLAKYDDRR